MNALLVLLLTPGAWGPAGCLPVGGRLFARPASRASAPMFMPAPAPVHSPAPWPVVTPAPDDDALERARAEGRAEARAQMRAARRAAGPCSPECTCGCAGGGACPCGGGEAAAPLFGREGPEDDDGPAYYRNGRRVTRDEAIDAVGRGRGDSRIPADAGLPSLSLMGGAEPARKALRRLLEAEPALKARLKWQDYPAGHPLTRGHEVEGLTVYLQAADGAVLLREANLSEADAAALLDRLKEILGLKPKTPPPAPKGGPDAPAGPGGRPATPPATPLTDELKKVPPLAWAGMALFALLWLSERTKREG